MCLGTRFRWFWFAKFILSPKWCGQACDNSLFTATILRILFLLPLLCVFGCGSASHQSAAGISGDSTVSGRVLFTGTAPQPVKLDLSANPTCERQHLRPVYSEDLLVNKKGGLRNVLVRVKSGLPEAHWTVPVSVAKLDQVGCVYQPHVLALMAGQTLEISNSDPLNHNVHAEAFTNTAFNVAQPPRAEKLLRQFDRPETMVPITCGVHAWMRGYVSVLDHPFFAVTDEDGDFRIDSLPPGSYTLEAVHEKLGRQERSFTVAAKARAAIDFAYTESCR